MPDKKNLNPHSMPDEELLKLYRETGNNQYFSIVLERYTHLLFAHCMRNLKDGEAAKDATQEILIKISEIILKTAVQKFDAYLFITAKHYCLSVLKKRDRHLTIEPTDDKLFELSENEIDIDALQKNDQLFGYLEICRQNLAVDQKRAINLFFDEKLSYNQISETTGWAWEQVRTLLQTAKRNLKSCIQKSINYDAHA